MYNYVKGLSLLMAKAPRVRKWEFRNEIELTYFLKVIAGDKESLKEHKMTTGSYQFHTQVQDVLALDLPVVRKWFPVIYHIHFHIHEPKALIFTYHILKRLVLGTDEGGNMSHFRRAITSLVFEFDFASY